MSHSISAKQLGHRSERHQRFYMPAFQGILLGLQNDGLDRYVIDLAGHLSPNSDEALIVDADLNTGLFEALSMRFYRQFWSSSLQRWV